MAFCYDTYGLEHVELDGRVLFSGSADPVQSVPISVTAGPEEQLLLKAEDLAGNVLTEVITISELVRDLAWSRASHWAATTDTASDAPMAASAGAPSDSVPPRVTLEPQQESIVIHRDLFSLSIFASDPGTLASVQVNGENQLPPPEEGALTKFRGTVRLPVNPGTNHFEVVVCDGAGNCRTNNLAVDYRELAYLDERYRLMVGVPPVASPEEAQVAQRVHIYMRREVGRNPLRFALALRDEYWEDVLLEHDISHSQLADPRTALLIGKIRPCDMLFLSSLIPEADGFSVYVEVADTSNGRIRGVPIDVFIPADDPLEMQEQLAGLVTLIEQQFPLLEGEIVRVRGRSATIDLGSKHGVFEGHALRRHRPR